MSSSTKPIGTENSYLWGWTASTLFASPFITTVAVGALALGSLVYYYRDSDKVKVTDEEAQKSLLKKCQKFVVDNVVKIGDKVKEKITGKTFLALAGGAAVSYFTDSYAPLMVAGAYLIGHNRGETNARQRTPEEDKLKTELKCMKLKMKALEQYNPELEKTYDELVKKCVRDRVKYHQVLPDACAAVQILPAYQREIIDLRAENRAYEEVLRRQGFENPRIVLTPAVKAAGMRKAFSRPDPGQPNPGLGGGEYPGLEMLQRIPDEALVQEVMRRQKIAQAQHARGDQLREHRRIPPKDAHAR